VVNGFVGTALRGSKPTPRRTFSATTGEVVLVQWGRVTPANRKLVMITSTRSEENTGHGR